jgi:hypothetical protein
MAFKTFADSDTLPASDLNTYLMGQALVKATSSTRPASPGEGSAVYETDTDKLMVYTTATTGWQPPWNLPWGRIAHAVQTSAQTGIGASLTDLTSLTATITMVANRYYKVTLFVPFSQVAADGAAILAIDQAGTQIASSGFTAAVGYFTEHAAAITTGSGSVTIKGRASTSAGTLSTNVAATSPALLLIEDVGPSAAPA